jgi:hypothetical protein
VLLVVVTACQAAVVGPRLYSANCAGVMAATPTEGPATVDFGPVPDLRYLAAHNGGVFARAWVADVIDGRNIVKAHGDRQMPVWGNAFAQLDVANGSAEARTAAKVNDLVDYLAATQLSD